MLNLNRTLVKDKDTYTIQEEEKCWGDLQGTNWHCKLLGWKKMSEFEQARKERSNLVK